MPNHSERKVDLENEFPVLMDAILDNGLTPEEGMFLFMGRLHENGPPGTEFGSKRSAGKGLRAQAGDFAVTIVNNRDRYDKYLKAGGKPNYTLFFAHYGSKPGHGWAPIVEVPKAVADMNANWTTDVDALIAQHLKTWMPRIKEGFDESMKKEIIGDQQTGVLK